MALTPTEAAILDLYDKGLTAAAIIARGFSPAKVRFTCSTFGSSLTNAAADRRRETNVRSASSSLLAAIRDARGVC